MHDAHKELVLKLHDIKGLVEVPDHSLYLFVAVVVGALLLLIALVYVMYRFKGRKKKLNLQKFYLEQLRSVDLSKPKEAAYTLTKYGRLLDKDQPQNSAYMTMLDALQNYKYRKNVHAFDDETLRDIEIFLGRL